MIPASIRTPVEIATYHGASNAIAQCHTKTGGRRCDNIHRRRLVRMRRQADIEGKVHESKYSLPFPLQQGGEQIDFLVRVKDMDHGYQFNLVFVEPRHWPDERKDQLRRLYKGYRLEDTDTTAYPVRLRIRIDSVGKTRGRPVHIDQEVCERSPPL